MLLINVDGGLGRVICAIPALEKCAESKDITIISCWPEVFQNNPILKNVHGNRDNTNLWDTVIRGNRIIFPEPYQRFEYYSQQEHLIESFNAILNETPSFSYPKLYLTEFEKAWASDFVRSVKTKTNKRKLVAFQPFGATFDINKADNTERSLSLGSATLIANKFMAFQSDSVLINCTNHIFSHPNIWQQKFTTRQLFAAISVCDAVLTVDSCVSHIGKAFNKKGSLILGGTYVKNVGYTDYKIFQKNGYPKAYDPIRICNFVNKNHGAMSWTNQELDEIVKSIYK